MDPVQEIKSRLDVADLVAAYIPLKRAGKYLKGLCPFHNEKTPSFYVSSEKQLAYCFSCHKGGDMFQFIQDIEGIDFKEALELLAEKANVDLSQYKTSKSISKEEKNDLKSAHELANKFFVQQLWETEDGKKVLEYLKSRGLTEAVIRDFQIGFAPDELDALYRFLLEKGVTKDVALNSTLVVARDAQSQSVAQRLRHGRVRNTGEILPLAGCPLGFPQSAIVSGGTARQTDSL